MGAPTSEPRCNDRLGGNKIQGTTFFSQSLSTELQSNNDRKGPHAYSRLSAKAHFRTTRLRPCNLEVAYDEASSRCNESVCIKSDRGSSEELTSGKVD
jgi:hypothetical protein